MKQNQTHYIMTPSELYAIANAAGNEEASKVKLATYSIHSVDVYGNAIANTPTFQMQGLCGFASINVKPSSSKLGSWLKANGLARKDSYLGGLTIRVGAFGQCFEQKESYAYAFAKVLQENGIRAYADSRLD